MVQILQNINFILHSNALLIIKLQLVNNFYRSLLSIRLQSCFFNFSEGSLAQHIVMQFVFLHENFHIAKLKDEVGRLAHHVILSAVHFRLLNPRKSVLCVYTFTCGLLWGEAVSHLLSLCLFSSVSFFFIVHK